LRASHLQTSFFYFQRREKDLDEVLQSTTIFSNVSKGVLAKREDLVEVFGTDDENIICMKILSEGDLQVSDKERKVELDTLFRDVSSVLSEKCINPVSNRPYTISMLERALKDVHFSVDPKRPAKAQALEALPLLQEKFPIQRASMRLRITVPMDASDELMDLLTRKGAVVEERDFAGTRISTLCLVEPGAFREIHALVQGAKGGGRVEVVSLAATAGESETADGIESLTAPASKPMHQNIVILADRDPEATMSKAVAPSHVAISGNSGYVAAPVASVPAPRRPAGFSSMGTGSSVGGSESGDIVYAKGPVSGIPEDHAARRERFSELDVLQDGWTVELRSKGEGGTVDAVFFSPRGERVGLFAMARRMALQAHKEIQGMKEVP